jgi:hypothetical protein
LTRTDDSYNSIIWAAAESSMAIVATSIPVMRVFFKQAINSALSDYNASNRSKSQATPSNSAGTQNTISSGKPNKRTTEKSDRFSRESMKEVFGRGSRNYVELDDLAVDEATGRVTVATPESLVRTPERHEPSWHV